jgi:hypothetical protein
MTKALEEALKAASILPEADQDALAEAILAEIGSEETWERSFSSSQDVLKRLADKALKEHRSGQTRRLDPDDL